LKTMFLIVIVFITLITMLCIIIFALAFFKALFLGVIPPKIQHVICYCLKYDSFAKVFGFPFDAPWTLSMDCIVMILIVMNWSKNSKVHPCWIWESQHGFQPCWNWCIPKLGTHLPKLVGLVGSTWCVEHVSSSLCPLSHIKIE
jgi:hypothetical protein